MPDGGNSSSGEEIPLPPRIKDVIVIGAGIGGLVVANALRRKGLDVKVYERSSNLSRDTGAGCGLSQNGQACLHSVGFSHKQIMSISTPVLEHILCVNGQVLARSDYPAHLYEKYGIPLTGTMRGDLINLMAEPLRQSKGTLHLGKKVTGIEQPEGSNRVRVSFASGETREADLVIGADGINSITAKHVLGEALEPAVYSGYSIFFGVIDDFDKGPALPPPSEASTLAEMVDHPSAIVQALSPSKLFMVPGGAGRDKKLVWKLGYKTDTPPDRKAWEAQPGLVRKEVEAHLRKNYPPDFPVWGLLARTKDSRLLHFGLFSRPHKDIWHRGRVVLLGDAAHATLPHVGQGANMAIEDGVVLTQCLEGAGKGFRDIEAGLEEFYRRRKERTRRIVDSASYVGMFMNVQNPVALWLRDTLLKYGMQYYRVFAEKEILKNCPVPIHDPRRLAPGTD